MPAIRAGGKERCRQWLISHYAQMTPARRARNACDIRRNRGRCRAINTSAAWTGICACFFYLTNQRMMRRLYQSHQPPIRREPLRLRRIFFLTTLCLLRILSLPARYRLTISRRGGRSAVHGFLYCVSGTGRNSEHGRDPGLLFTHTKRRTHERKPRTRAGNILATRYT